MALGLQTDGPQHRLKLSQCIRSAKSEWCLVAARPKTGAVWHNKQSTPLGRQDPITFVQKLDRMLAGFQPMQNNQPIHRIRLNRPKGFFAKHRDIRQALRPGHHPLRPRHQSRDPTRAFQVGTQQGGSKPKADNRHPRHFRPQLQHLRPDCALRRPAQTGAIVKRPEIEDVEVHCSPGCFGRHFEGT